MIIKQLCQLSHSSPQVKKAIKNIVQQDIGLNSSDKLNQYLSGIKINSAQSRQEYQELTIQVFNGIQDKQSAYFLILNSLNKVAMKTLIIDISSQIFLQQKQFGDSKQILQNWLNIPVEYLPQFIEAYNLKLEQFQDVDKRMNLLFQNKKITDALKLIQLFHQFLDFRQYIDKFIQIERIQEFAKICEYCPEIIPELVTQLSAQSNKISTKLAKELIQKYNLKKEDFPKLICNMNKMAVENIYFPKVFEFHRVEERLSDYPFMLVHVVDKLLANNMIDEAYSIVKRHNLDRNVVGNYIENPLLSQDEFNLTEAVCLGMDANEYIQFKHYGMQEQNIKWIGNQDQLRECAQIILSSKIVGFDTEFQHYFDEFEFGGIALLQIATYENIYLIDAIHFQEDPLFIQFLADFFSGDVQKVGHSVGNDLHEIGIKIKLPPNLEEKNMIDLSKLYNIVVQNESQTPVSLANQAHSLLKLKLSKAECFSNWTRRPLRKCQQYYAAMDAYICLVIYDKLVEIQENKDTNLDQFQSKKQQIQQKVIIQEKHLRYHPKYEYMIQNKKMKFLIDEMLKKLSSFLRNLGIDAAQIEKNDHNGMEQLGIAEERIIVTRDKKYFSRPLSIPCFLLSHDLNTEQQFEELQDYLKFTTSPNGLLSRCVKCNSEEIKVIEWNEAQKYLDFKNTETKIKEFWQCVNCKQVYWEGNQFKNSKERFTKVCQKNK